MWAGFNNILWEHSKDFYTAALLSIQEVNAFTIQKVFNIILRLNSARVITYMPLSCVCALLL